MFITEIPIVETYYKLVKPNDLCKSLLLTVKSRVYIYIYIHHIPIISSNPLKSPLTIDIVPIPNKAV